MIFINLTPHTINLNDGRSFETSGKIARVKSSFIPFDENGITEQTFGETENLPSPEADTCFIVSAVVIAALKGSRNDVVAPATNHPDVVRNGQGQVVSVPGFTR